MRLLPGLGNDARRPQVEEAAGVGEGLLGPGLEEDVAGLVEALPVLLLRHVIAGELRRAIAAPYPDVEPAPGDDVDEGELLGQPQRMVEGQDGGGQPDAHPARE